jgi:hypothetical protein
MASLALVLCGCAGSKGNEGKVDVSLSASPPREELFKAEKDMPDGRTFTFKIEHVTLSDQQYYSVIARVSGDANQPTPLVFELQLAGCNGNKYEATMEQGQEANLSITMAQQGGSVPYAVTVSHSTDGPALFVGPIPQSIQAHLSPCNKSAAV